MDRRELKYLLKPFQEKCAENGKPLSDICIEEAFPGDTSTSYILQVKAPWVDEMYCSTALDFLFDVLWETTDEETRKKVFSIQVLDSSDELHCYSETAVQKT
ncbi:hypothetical protein [Runella slithyformis]|uniref:Uncharacterized protein n=1 Tax=Runella slithyformis (strain ATCC 29530 / DSM 19594 / LMG 11500 / NCIMB 11436 / LSU 4) TaxID=761193 RepID=A0A7U3ZMI4_RUNSL|nr:hypothetical protein [Runella slithyformis]AEI49966.1 hypothetical protein Runsl_3607 [Runella slithyformis DSM 19594]